MESRLGLDTVIGLDLRVPNSFSVGGFGLDDYIKYYMTPDLILQLSCLKERLRIKSFAVLDLTTFS